MENISMQPEEMLTVQEAAEMLGVHPNTIRNRVKAGQYRAEWAPSPHGPRQLIPRSSLVSDATQPVEGSKPLPVASDPIHVRQLQEEAIQRVVAPFIEQLDRIARENGALRERIRQLEDETIPQSYLVRMGEVADEHIAMHRWDPKSLIKRLMH